MENKNGNSKNSSHDEPNLDPFGAAIAAAFEASEAQRVQRSGVELPLLSFHNGPYAPPSAQIGDSLVCARFGEVKVVGWSDGPVRWPMCRVSGPRSLILCGDLVRAVECEAGRAVSLAWGVSRFTVCKWRRVLGVPELTTGTRQRYIVNIKHVLTSEQNEQGLRRAHAVEARQSDSDV